MHVLLALILVLALSCPLLAQGPSAHRLTVQQNGQALVTETRTLPFPRGKASVALEGCAATMDPHTLQLRPLDAGLKILGARHEAALSGPTALLRAHVGKKLTVIIPDGLTREGRVRKEAVLVSAEEAPVFLVDGLLYAGPVEAVLYPVQAMSPSPRILLSADNSGAEKHKIEASYVAGEVSWRMDYALTADKDFAKARLLGTVSLSNRSGIDYPSAKVELLAGEPRQAFGGANKMLRSVAAIAVSEDMAQARPEALFEYHLYKLPGTVALPNQGLVQFPLVQAPGVTVSKRLVARASAVPQGRVADPIPQTAQALISFRNSGAQGLGQPLPKGVIHVYQEDDGARRLVGEAQLDRVAKGAKAEVVIGQAFDLTIERMAKEYERTGKNNYMGSWEITIRNSKAEKQRLVVQESFPGKWRVTESSHKVTRSSAHAAEFEIDVPPTGEGQPLVLTYAFTLDM